VNRWGALGAYLSLLLVLLGGAIPSARAEPPIHRVALAVAARDGGPERPALRHVEHDARALLAVLGELGGVAPRDAALLLDPTPAALLAALRALSGAGGARTELVFYYSGHSDERGLLLGRERLDYDTLRSTLLGLPFSVRIAILDSCASGAMTRDKGGVLRAPFLFDASTAVTGYAILASASGDEAAQESDQLGASYFTHALVSGLRGAADKGGEGTVTLAEAYRYAFDTTLERTASTLFGAQHPAYEMRLSGTGDLVLTDLRAATSELRLRDLPHGALYARSAEGELVLEARVQAGRPLVLSLPRGHYELTWVGSDRAARAAASVTGGLLELGWAAFVPLPRTAAVARGPLGGVRTQPLGVALVPRLSTNRSLRPARVHNRVSLSLLYDDPDVVEGAALSLGFAAARDALSGLALGGLGVVVGGELRGAALSLGPEVVSGPLDGAAVSLTTAIALGPARALLAAPVVYADDLRGVALGAVTITGDVTGLSVAALNVARRRVRGVQLGVINFADEADVSLGVLGLTRKGGVHVSLASSDVALAQLSLRLDATYNYSFVSAAIHPLGTDAQRGALYGGGVGAKIPIWRRHLWLDLECGVYALQRLSGAETFAKNLLIEPRVLFRLPLHDHFSPFLGLALHVLVQRDDAYRVRTGFSAPATAAAGAAGHAVFPGYVAGIVF
jgi:Caspase domain